MKKKLLSFWIGLILTFIFFELALNFAHDSFSSDKSKTLIDFEGKEVIRILALGESTTAVAANKEENFLVKETAYPKQLESILNEKQSKYHFQVINKGIMGGDTNMILGELEQNIERYRPHLVISMMGMKDQAEGKNFFGINREETNLFKNILNKSKVYQMICLLLDIEANEKIDQLDERVEISFRSIFDDPTLNQYRGKDKNKILLDYKKAIEFWHTGRFSEALDISKKLFDRYGVGPRLLAEILERQDAKGSIAKLIQNKVKNFRAISDYDLFYSLLGKYSRNDKDFLEGLNLNPNGLRLWLERAKYFQAQGKTEEALSFLEKSRKQLNAKLFKTFQSHPEKLSWGEKFILSEYYFVLARLYEGRGELNMAEGLLRHIIKVSPRDYLAVSWLSDVLAKQNKVNEQRRLLENHAMKMRRFSEFFELDKYYKKQKVPYDAKKLFNIALKKVPHTISNFKKLAQVCQENKIKLVLVQYPTFSVEILKMLSGNLPNTTYVDNEIIFDGAKRSQYFYKPKYPYKFNHFTASGANVLAENIARKIERIYNFP